MAWSFAWSGMPLPETESVSATFWWWFAAHWLFHPVCPEDAEVIGLAGKQWGRRRNPLEVCCLWWLLRWTMAFSDSWSTSCDFSASDPWCMMPCDERLWKPWSRIGSRSSRRWMKSLASGDHECWTWVRTGTGMRQPLVTREMTSTCGL